MEKWTILIANIRHKKGSFASIVILMAVVSMAFLSVLGVWDNLKAGVDEAHKRADTADITCLINSEQMDSALLSKVESHPLVERVKTVETLVCNRTSCNKKSDFRNLIMVQEMGDRYRVFNSNATGFLKKVPELKQGEIYISLGLKTNLNCEKGDTIKLSFCSGSHDFKIAGFVEDSELGASVIGVKNVFISRQDYEKLHREIEEYSTEDSEKFITQLLVYQIEDSSLSDLKFARRLNMDTGVADMSKSSVPKSSLIRFTILMPKIFCGILTVFVLLLLIAVLIIMCHSISTGMEMEYTTFGIMKAMGFEKKDIQFIIGAQYLLAEILGILLGIIPAFFVCAAVGDSFVPLTGIIPRRALAFGKGGLVLLLVLLVSILCIMAVTWKVGKITPVCVIAGGKKDIYFDSRIHVGIRKKMLSAGLAFRQFTSGKKQYIGMMMIVTILVYFMTAMMLLANSVSVESLDSAYSNVDIHFKEKVSDEKIKEIEEVIGKYSAYRLSRVKYGNYYSSVNGEQMMLCMFGDAKHIGNILKGRIPRYDNEIVATEIVAESLGLKIGDKVTVGHENKKEEYIITGLNQNMNDAGMNFSMTVSAAKKLYGELSKPTFGYILENKTQGEKIAETLNKKYGSLLEAQYDNGELDPMIEMGIYAVVAVVYLFSAIFVLVVVQMVCSKAFLRERQDIGIYKAMGFTVGALRLQFAFRFMFVAAVGAAFGCGAALLFGKNMLGMILRQVGISSMDVRVELFTILIPIVMICVYFFFFTLLSSRKIKRVEVRELITE